MSIRFTYGGHIRVRWGLCIAIQDSTLELIDFSVWSKLQIKIVKSTNKTTRLEYAKRLKFDIYVSYITKKKVCTILILDVLL